jgi:hypothetical protein
MECHLTNRIPKKEKRQETHTDHLNKKTSHQFSSKKKDIPTSLIFITTGISKRKRKNKSNAQ